MLREPLINKSVLQTGGGEGSTSSDYDVVCYICSRGDPPKPAQALDPVSREAEDRFRV